MPNPRIMSIAWTTLSGQRPRLAGCNARLGEHGLTVEVPIAQLTTDDGVAGFGFCRLDETQAGSLLGQSLDRLVTSENGVLPAGMAVEYPLWDLLGHLTGQPVYALAAAMTGKNAEPLFSVPCYDTSLYFDDLHLESHNEAADLIAAEAMAGFERGHRAFKIKVGRGARHMPLDSGTQRDIAVVQAVRQTVGPAAPIMLDANNGYNLNLAKQVLRETADCHVYWLEEAFHEDPVLYRDLKEWLAREDLPALIADGEGLAAPPLRDWAREGLVDVLQYDIFGYGFTPWLSLGRQLDNWGVKSAPHHYGRHLGNFTAGHLAAAISGFQFVEWDEVTTPGIDTSAYTVQDGQVQIPNLPGFGLGLDQALFSHMVQESGFRLAL